MMEIDLVYCDVSIKRKEGRVTMTRQEGEFCNKKCPKYGAMLLRNERGDKWCSFPGREYLLKGLHEKEKRLLGFIRRLGYGEITIRVQDGLLGFKMGCRR